MDRQEHFDLETALLIPGECVVFNIGKTYRTLLKPFERAFASVGISTMQYGLLIHIAINQPVSGRDISSLTGHDPSTLSRNLTVIEKRDWISVSRDEGGDKRKRLYALTTEGTVMLRRAIPIWEQIHRKILDSIGRDRWECALDVLRELQDFEIEEPTNTSEITSIEPPAL